MPFRATNSPTSFSARKRPFSKHANRSERVESSDTFGIYLRGPGRGYDESSPFGRVTDIGASR
ncbi:hypothetical protein BRD01_10010 [Halobacteriales archaeon QS_8_65_32]|nr:MAG: hypothetical protein BRD01_10010 [Halobacteriales archaeon QS_8_65_32]